jgi:hypothetical protein
MRFKLAGVILSLSINVQASEIFSDKVTLFEIKPQVCIVKKIGEQCTLQTTVKWVTTEAMEVCLTQQSEVLQCWKDSLSISEKLAINLTQTAQVLLVDQHKDKLASEILQVNALNPKKKRRRLRSAWSLF